MTLGRARTRCGPGKPRYTLPLVDPCPFCERIARGDVTAGDELVVSFPDAYPLNSGHALIVPRRHAADYRDLSEAEQQAMWRMIAEVCTQVEREWQPAGYNIGINIGAAAGQTVDHAHLHVIPRYPGDVEEPRGGIRWVVPSRARYWT